KSTTSEPRYATPSHASGRARTSASRTHGWRCSHAASRRRTEGAGRGTGFGSWVAVGAVIDIRDGSTRGPRWEPRVERSCRVGRGSALDLGPGLDPVVETLALHVGSPVDALGGRGLPVQDVLP